MSELKERLKNSPVYIAECDSYDTDKIYECLRLAADAIGFSRELIENKRVLIKPNLVLAKKPEFAATTHPAFIRAVHRLVTELGASSVTVADSPGGPYNETALALVYRVCELAPLKDEGISLNYDFTHKPVRCSGVKLKNFNMITPVYDADVVIDLCKLKTHTLTGMSCSTKNLFGVIPGIEKFEMHSNFPKIEDFSEMLVDLSEYVLDNKTFLAICDAVLSMEGDGPSHGTPIKTDMILASLSPYNLDLIAEHIIGADGVTRHLDSAASHGLLDRDIQKITVLGKTDYPTFDFKKPKTETFLGNLPNFMGGRFAKFFESKPKITNRCIGCGKCEESCPRHTITIERRRKKKIAKIHRKSCIRCYCCQELCPIGAIDTASNPIIKLIH